MRPEDLDRVADVVNDDVQHAGRAAYVRGLVSPNQERPDQERPDQERPDQERADQERADQERAAGG